MRRGIGSFSSILVVALFALTAVAPSIGAAEKVQPLSDPFLDSPAGPPLPPIESSVDLRPHRSIAPSASSSSSDNWWKFKHDNLNGGSSAASVPPYAYLNWETDLQANIFASSPAIVDGVTYASSGRTTGNGYVHAFNITTGALQWRYSFVGSNGTFSSGPAVTTDKVLVGYGDGLGNGGIKALRLSDGQEQWDFPANNNCASSPAVNGNSVYIGCRDGKVYALNLANGNKLWERSLNSRVDSSPAVAYGLVFAGNCAGIPNCNGIMYALYETNGSVAWQYSVNGGNINSGAAVSGGAIFFATQQSMELVSLNATKGTLVWRKNLTGPMDMTPSVHAGKVFIGTGNGTSSKMLAINVTNGNKIWEYPVVGNLFSSPAVASGKVIFGTSEPSVLALNEATGQSVWSFTAVRSNVFSSPAVYENRVAFGDLANRFYVLGPDNTLPTIATTYPVDNAVNFPVGDNFTVSFSEEMDPATAVGQYSLAPSGGNLTHSWDVDNKILSIMHPQPLPPETNYTLTLLTGFKDAHGNALAAGKTIRFRTRDVTPPRLLSYSPTGNITDAPVMQQVKLVFNEAMAGNATCMGVVVLASAGGNTQKQCAWSADKRTVDITPTPQWTGNNRYDVQVTKGSTDVAGNPIVNPTQFSFTTLDTSPPQVLNVEPANNALNVPADAIVKVRFNEPVDPASFEAGLTLSPAVTGGYSYNGTEAIFVPGAALAGDTEYTVQLLGVKDVVGNAMPSAYVWKFRTKDTTPPTFTRSEPGTGAVDIPRNIVIKLYFNEKMDAVSLEAAVTMSNVPTVDANWDDAGGFANITPGAILEEGRTYFVNISTAAKDLAGNGLTAPVSIFFTTVKAPGNGNTNKTEPGLLDKIFQYWPFILIAIIVIIILAAVIPSKRYLSDYYGVSEEDLKKSEIGAKKEEKQVNCEVCSLSLERDDYTKCKSCGRATHVECLAKVKKCLACKEPM